MQSKILTSFPSNNNKFQDNDPDFYTFFYSLNGGEATKIFFLKGEA